jgi:PAS domain S-box-containing protein
MSQKDAPSPPHPRDASAPTPAVYNANDRDTDSRDANDPAAAADNGAPAPAEAPALADEAATGGALYDGSHDGAPDGRPDGAPPGPDATTRRREEATDEAPVGRHPGAPDDDPSTSLDDRPSYDRIDIPSDEEVRELLKRAIEAANNSIVISDPSQPDNPIVYVNQGFKRLTGYPEDEILGRNCRFLQNRPDGSRDSDQPAVRAIARAVSKGDFCRAVLRNYKRDGTMFWNELYLTPVFDADGNVTSYVGVQNDITERVELNQSLERRVRERTQALEQKTHELEQKTAELERQRDELAKAKEKAEAASRAKSAFLANMSHEIRTPLTAILGLADVIRVKSGDGMFEEHTRRIKSAGERLMETLSSLLTLAKLESDSMDVDLEPVRLTEQASEVVELFRERAEEKGLELTLHVDRSARYAVTRLDRGALNSALQNLISNAIKFTDEGRIDVRVSCTPEAGTGSIAVHDTGIGISEEFKPYLFEDFSQESEGLTREYDGSGLGLSITKQLVEAMGGSISVESTRGEGSVFTVTFSLAAGSPATQSPEAEVEGHFDAARVLLVEDNDNTVFLVDSLIGDRVALDVATNATKALEMARDYDYDLLLLDINLGAGGSGVDLLHQIRQGGHQDGAAAVAVTAIAMPGDREKLLRQGFDDYLAKPFEAGELYALLQRYLA